jgi:glyoxylase-like metal-dependent hydrolase (beta-lactamase superfamily II)
MTIEKTVSSLFAINTYWLIENKHVILIDPITPLKYGDFSCGSFLIDLAFLTHEHYDHIYCVNELKTEYGFPIACGENAKEGLLNPTLNMSRYMELLKQYIPFGTGEAVSCDYSCKADRLLKDGETIIWQNHKLFIKETPGHSKGSICILLDDQYLFSGDTIFKDYPTATRLPGGSTKAFNTITETWLNSLPQDIMVYPGHTEPFRLIERYKSSH